MTRNGKRTNQLPWPLLNSVTVVIGFIANIIFLVTLPVVDYSNPQGTIFLAFLLLFIIIYTSTGLLAWLRLRARSPASRKGQEAFTMLVSWPMLTWWAITFFLEPLSVSLLPLHQLLALVATIIGTTLLGLFLFRGVVSPLAASFTGWLSPYKLGGEESKQAEYVVACFRLTTRPDWYEQKTHMDLFNRSLEEFLDKHTEWSHTDWTCIQTGVEWIFAGINLSATDIFNMARETIRIYRAFLLKADTPKYELDITLGMESANTFLIKHLALGWNAVPVGYSVECARRLAEIAEEGTALATTQFLEALVRDHGGQVIVNQYFRRLNYFDLHTMRPEVYEIYIKDEIGRQMRSNPRAPILFETSAYSIHLVEHLDRLGIRPWSQLAELRKNASRAVLAVDGVISIVEAPGYKGWAPDPNLVQIDITNEQPVTYWPPNWKDERREAHKLEPGAIDRDKVYIDKWEPPILDRGGKLRLTFGLSKYRDNRALEEILNLNRAKPDDEKENYEWNVFKWKPNEKCKNVFRWRDGKPIDLRREYLQDTISFWEYLPNMVILTPVIVCSDEQVVFMLRSDHVRYYPNHWSISIEEQLDPSQDNLEETLLQKAAERAIEEEIGVDIKDMKILSVYREWHNGNVNIAILVHANEVSLAFKNAWSARAVDMAEFKEMSFEPITDLEAMISVLRSPNYKGRKFHPGSKYRLLMALLAEHGYDALIKQLYEISQKKR